MEDFDLENDTTQKHDQDITKPESPALMCKHKMDGVETRHRELVIASMLPKVLEQIQEEYIEKADWRERVNFFREHNDKSVSEVLFATALARCDDYFHKIREFTFS